MLAFSLLGQNSTQEDLSDKRIGINISSVGDCLLSPSRTMSVAACSYAWLIHFDFWLVWQAKAYIRGVWFVAHSCKKKKKRSNVCKLPKQSLSVACMTTMVIGEIWLVPVWLWLMVHISIYNMTMVLDKIVHLAIQSNRAVGQVNSLHPATNRGRSKHPKVHFSSGLPCRILVVYLIFMWSSENMVCLVALASSWKLGTESIWAWFPTANKSRIRASQIMLAV